MADFHLGIYSATAQASQAFKWRTVVRAFAVWGVDPFPPTPAKVAVLGAVLKSGRYRSAAGYLSLYRTSSARRGHELSPELCVAFRDAARSCTMGAGSPGESHTTSSASPS